MRPIVIDTNVAVVAAGGHERAGRDCVEACEDLLLDVVERRMLLRLDEAGEIITEYTSALGHSGRPSIGEAFVKWAHDHAHAGVGRGCELVALHLTSPDDPRGYEEIPDLPGLRTFDPSDRKFLAAGLATSPPAEIANAVDSDWAEHADAIGEAGGVVRTLCPEFMHA